MEENQYKTIRNTLFGVVVGTVLAVAVHSGFNYLSQRAVYEPQRINAVRELMESQGFQNYVRQRKDLAERVMSEHEHAATTFTNSIVEATLGTYILQP